MTPASSTTTTDLGPAEIETLLHRDSGVPGGAEIASDLRVLEAGDDPRVRAAIDLFVNRIAREPGGLAAALQGIDALVFTATHRPGSCRRTKR